jgi:hypothetical protein
MMPKTDVLEQLKARIAWHRKFEPAPVSILVDAAAEIERLRTANADLLAALEELIPEAAEAFGAMAWEPEDETLLARARAVIAKAKGETTC